MDLNFKNLTPAQQQILDEYCKDNGKKLDKICRKLIYKKDVPLYLEDDLYSLAQWTFLESLKQYDETKEIKFETFLIGNIWRSFYDWTRDGQRGVRCNLLRDGKGKIVRDKKNKNKVTIISSISLDAKLEEDVDWAEKVASDFNLDDEVCLSSKSHSEKVNMFLKNISKRERKIAECIMEGYLPQEIQKILHISRTDYNDAIKDFKTYENVCILLGGR